MIRRPPRSTRKESSAASDVYKRQIHEGDELHGHNFQVVFNITIRKAEGITLGLAVSCGESDRLLVEEVKPGAMAAWNKQCASGGKGPMLQKIVRAGDHITQVNNISNDFVAMLNECCRHQTVNLTVARREPQVFLRQSSLRGEAAVFDPSCEAHTLTPFFQ